MQQQISKRNQLSRKRKTKQNCLITIDYRTRQNKTILCTLKTSCHAYSRHLILRLVYSPVAKTTKNKQTISNAIFSGMEPNKQKTDE